MNHWSAGFGYWRGTWGRVHLAARYNVRRFHLGVGFDWLGRGEVTLHLGPLLLALWVEPRPL